MPFGAHETMEVHELLNETINMINHFSLYEKEVRDQELGSMIQRQLRSAIQCYDRLVAYTHDYSAANQMVPPYESPQTQPNQIQYGLQNPQDQMPQMQGRLNDQQIASSMLLCHKNSAKNHIAHALECADPHIRQMMLDGAVSCTNQAYEVFLYMNRQGQYQVPTMQDHTAKTFLHTYQPMEQPAGYSTAHTGMGQEHHQTGMTASMHPHPTQPGIGMERRPDYPAGSSMNRTMPGTAMQDPMHQRGRSMH